MNNIILSICIPSYNRILFLEQSLRDILSCKDDRFEIIISDNSEYSDAPIRNIKDHRLHFYKGEKKVGFSNVTKVLTLGTGKYSLLLLDKDRLNVEYLSKLIDILCNMDVSCGCVSLSNNITTPIIEQIYKKGVVSLNKMAYLSRHASGYFFDTHLFKHSESTKSIIYNKDPFPFPFELINAELSLLNDTAFISIPILSLELPSVSAKVKSTCFLEKDIYFSPNGRKQHFLRYIKSLSSLDLLDKHKCIILNRVYYFYLYSITIGYALCMKDPILTSHSNLDVREVSIGELLRHSINAIPVYWKSTKWLRPYYRLKVLVLSQSRCLVSIIKNCIFSKK